MYHVLCSTLISDCGSAKKSIEISQCIGCDVETLRHTAGDQLCVLLAQSAELKAVTQCFCEYFMGGACLVHRLFHSSVRLLLIFY